VGCDQVPVEVAGEQRVDVPVAGSLATAQPEQLGADARCVGFSLGLPGLCRCRLAAGLAIPDRSGPSLP